MFALCWFLDMMKEETALEKDKYKDANVITDVNVFIHVVDSFLPYMVKKNDFQKELEKEDGIIWKVITSSDIAFCLTFITGSYDRFQQVADYNKRKVKLPIEKDRVKSIYKTNGCKEEQNDYAKLNDLLDDELEKKGGLCNPRIQWKTDDDKDGISGCTV